MKAARVNASITHTTLGSQFSVTANVASAAELRLAADRESGRIKSLRSELDAINRRIRVLKCRSVGGNSRKVCARPHAACYLEPVDNLGCTWHLPCRSVAISRQQ